MPWLHHKIKNKIKYTIERIKTKKNQKKPTTLLKMHKIMNFELFLLLEFQKMFLESNWMENSIKKGVQFSSKNSFSVTCVVGPSVNSLPNFLISPSKTRFCNLNYI
jgi:hypothetical protein